MTAPFRRAGALGRDAASHPPGAPRAGGAGADPRDERPGSVPAFDDVAGQGPQRLGVGTEAA